jgi:preprotein translocase subunit SecA
MRIFGGDRMKGMLNMLGVAEDEAIEHKMIGRSIETAQKRVEGHNFDMRKRVVEYDDVMNRHREVIYKRRFKALAKTEDYSEIDDLVVHAIDHESRHLASVHATGSPNEWNLEQLSRDVATIIGLVPDQMEQLKNVLGGLQSDAAVEDRLKMLFIEAYTNKKQQLGQHFGPALRMFYLRTIDTLWIEHLTTMNELRQGVGLQAYAQTDPIVAYKSEAFRLFQQLLMAIETQTARTIYRVELSEQPAPIEQHASEGA